MKTQWVYIRSLYIQPGILVCLATKTKYNKEKTAKHTHTDGMLGVHVYYMFMPTYSHCFFWIPSLLKQKEKEALVNISFSI